MARIIEAAFGAALFVGGLVLIVFEFIAPQPRGLAIAGSIVLAAAYLGGPGATNRRPASAS
jgi:hypothetical protein